MSQWGVPYDETGAGKVFAGAVALAALRLQQPDGSSWADQDLTGRVFVQVIWNAAGEQLRITGVEGERDGAPCILFPMTGTQSAALLPEGASAAGYRHNFAEVLEDGLAFLLREAPTFTVRGGPDADAEIPPAGTGGGSTTLYTVRQNSIVTVRYAGAPGAPGTGVPAGGAAGEVLAKASGDDFDTAWVESPAVSLVEAEASVRASADTSLTTRISTEETSRASADTSLTARASAEESVRAAADTSLTTRVAAEETARAGGDASLTTRISAAESVQSAAASSLAVLAPSVAVSAAQSAAVSAAASLIGGAPGALDTFAEVAQALGENPDLAADLTAGIASVAVRVSTEEVARTSGDTSLTSRISTAETAHSTVASSLTAVASSITARVSAEEVTRSSADTSLTTRVSSEESTRASQATSLTTRVSAEESTRASAVASLNTAKAPTASPTFTGPVTIAGQIVFPATQNASSDANTLDDYEEGTYTPSFLIGGSATGITYNAAAWARVGYYRKLGKSVRCWGRIYLTSKGSNSGAPEITVPFANGNPERVGLAAFVAGGSSLQSAGAHLADGASEFSLRNKTSSGFVTMTEANVTDTAYIIWDIEFET